MSRKPEQKFWRNIVRPKLGSIPGMEFDRIETGSTANNIPDVAYSYTGRHGWIELKACVIDPDTDTIDLSHFTGGQKRWLRDRGQTGGKCFLLVQADSQVFLIRWPEAMKVPKGRVKIDELRELSIFHWTRGIKVGDLKDVL